MSFPAETVIRRYGKSPEEMRRLAADLHRQAERIAGDAELSFAKERSALCREDRV